MKNDLLKQIPYAYAKKYGVLATQDPENSTVTIYHLPRVDIQALVAIRRFFDSEIECLEIDDIQFQQRLSTFYSAQSSIMEAKVGMEESLNLLELAEQIPTTEDLLENQDDAPIIRLINAIFSQAIKIKASDIHIETYESRVLVRHRVDGVLQKVLEIPRAIAPLVISRVKVMAKLDIAEKRIPQDGRISLRVGQQNIDVRVSTLPSNHGERIVLRILDRQAVTLDMMQLGMPPDIMNNLQELIAQPHGILLVTGPTGSGKTTSLYAMLTELNQTTRNILTIEDPIEYDLPGIGQTQVNTKVDMTFAKGLRAILRQDPDVVMIGEIRDLETAEIAIQASLTGHLVLSTLHTNSALGAITRLQDMGLESFLISSSIIGLLAQRLIRRLCPKCKQPHEITDAEKTIMELHTAQYQEIYEPVGCEFCNLQGYKGRSGIYELITPNESLRSQIHRRESTQALEQTVRATTRSIRADGFQRVLNGETSLAEILRVTTSRLS